MLFCSTCAEQGGQQFHNILCCLVSMCTCCLPANQAAYDTYLSPSQCESDFSELDYTLLKHCSATSCYFQKQINSSNENKQLLWKHRLSDRCAATSPSNRHRLLHGRTRPHPITPALEVYLSGCLWRCPQGFLVSASQYTLRARRQKRKSYELTERGTEKRGVQSWENVTGFKRCINNLGCEETHEQEESRRDSNVVLRTRYRMCDVRTLNQRHVDTLQCRDGITA